jgi:acetyl-CoA carboxylase carboxyl transferase subunit alpha
MGRKVNVARRMREIAPARFSCTTSRDIASVNASTALRTYLDFEKPVLELENKVAELKAMQKDGKGPQIADEIARLEQKAKAALVDTYARLTPWQKTLVARHPERPHALDFVGGLIEDFTPLAGDRYFAEDEAIVGGLGRFRNKPVLVLGHEKGSDTEKRIKHNFGMARPEGYRKAVRLM